MTTMTFDSIAYVRMLEEGGFTRQQAETQTEVLRRQAEVQARQTEAREEALRERLEAQRAALQQELERHDEAARRELATRGDVQDVRFEIAKVRGELKIAILKVSYKDLLRWLFGIMFAGFGALVVLLAKGFGWLRF